MTNFEMHKTIELLNRIYRIGYRYIAKDLSGEVFAYNERPIKSNKNSSWGADDDKSIISPKVATFDFLSWEDEEPTAIRDLIGGKNEVD